MTLATNKDKVEQCLHIPYVFIAWFLIKHIQKIRLYGIK